jgi:hypothetical protein
MNVLKSRIGSTGASVAFENLGWISWVDPFDAKLKSIQGQLRWFAMLQPSAPFCGSSDAPKKVNAEPVATSIRIAEKQNFP